MKKIDFVSPNNPDALGVLGHLIVVNKLVHSYQVQCLEEYLAICNTGMEDTCLPAILAGQDDAISFEQALNAFSEECLAIQECLYYMSAKLAYADACFDDSEEKILHLLQQRSGITPESCIVLSSQAHDDALVVRNDSNVLFTRPYTEPVTLKALFFRFIHWVYAFFCRIFHLPVKGKPNTAEYAAAINLCAEIAKDDFSVVQPIYKRLISQCGSTITELDELNRSLNTETELSAEVAKVVSSFADCLSECVLNQSQAAHSELSQKERTLSDFTFSLLGRTKAGKTTLHSILTGRDRNMIGVGMQRTTRYNRVYQWNLLRLIDTPGIGSPEADGRTDDEIAASILGESDVICLVIVDDSILQDVLEFMEKLAALNKPIIILLNHKENIEAEVKFKRYIEHPLDWLSTTREDNLQGHINRIRRYASEKGFDSLLSVYPVFLLSAKMAQEEKYARYSKLLWNGSNIDSFIDALKSWIAVFGPLKRSQTLLDGTVQNFILAEQEISQGLVSVQDKVEDLKRRKPTVTIHIRRHQETLLKEIKEYLTDQYCLLETQGALTFAEKHWNHSGDLSSKWEEYLKEIQFSSDIELKISQLVSHFSSELDDTVREVFEDFYFYFQSKGNTLGFRNSMMVDFRSFTRILGGALGTVGSIAVVLSNPIGWVLAAAGIALSLVSGLFKSKEKKRQEKINKLYDNLKNTIHNNAPENVNEIISQVRNETDLLIIKIDQLFDTLILELEHAIEIGNRLTESYQEQIEFLNIVFAWRILTFLLGSSELYQPDKISSLVTKVERKKGQITIYTPASVKRRTDTLKNIITETIEIVKTEA